MLIIYPKQTWIINENRGPQLITFFQVDLDYLSKANRLK